MMFLYTSLNNRYIYTKQRSLRLGIDTRYIHFYFFKVDSIEHIIMLYSFNMHKYDISIKVLYCLIAK